MKIAKSLETLARSVKEASNQLRIASTEQKNQALRHLQHLLQANEQKLLIANERDLLRARENNLSAALCDRLSLKGRIQGLIDAVETIIALEDPVGELIEERHLANGLLLQKKRVPLGVLGVIYEARPNVTVDVAALALKTGNSALLRGGKEAFYTNCALIDLIHEALKRAGLPKEAIQLLKTPSRAQLKQMLQLHTLIDVILPRGGEGLHRFCREHSQIPLISGGMGVCHLYVAKSADPARSIPVILNAKLQRPAACNALDTLLVDQGMAPTFLPLIGERLRKEGVFLHLDERAAEWARLPPTAFQVVHEADWSTEWLGLTLNIKIVESLQEAIAHVQRYGGHSDGILTEEVQEAERFVNAVDSAALYINASTRFTDGGQFGLGAEVAVSTQKLHARGPMGLKELTSYKWIARGNYHIRN